MGEKEELRGERLGQGGMERGGKERTEGGKKWEEREGREEYTEARKEIRAR